MSKFSTKLRQKQSIVPQQIIKSRLLELSIDELEKDLENEIQVNPVLEEKSIEESKSSNHSDPFLSKLKIISLPIDLAFSSKSDVSICVIKSSVTSLLSGIFAKKSS